MRVTSIAGILLLTASIVFIASFRPVECQWESKFIKVNKDGLLSYTPDEKGNTIPDFSRVGYYSGDKAIPDIR